MWRDLCDLPAAGRRVQQSPPPRHHATLPPMRARNPLDGTPPALAGLFFMEGPREAPPLRSGIPDGVMPMNRWMILPLAAATALTGACASTGSYGYDDGGYGYYDFSLVRRR